MKRTSQKFIDILILLDFCCLFHFGRFFRYTPPGQNVRHSGYSVSSERFVHQRIVYFLQRFPRLHVMTKMYFC